MAEKKDEGQFSMDHSAQTGLADLESQEEPIGLSENPSEEITFDNLDKTGDLPNSEKKKKSPQQSRDLTDTLSVRPGDVVLEATGATQDDIDAQKRNIRVRVRDVISRNILTENIDGGGGKNPDIEEVLKKTAKRNDMTDRWGQVFDAREVYEGPLQKLGEGGFGTVYKVKDAVTKKDLVVKIVKPVSESMIERLKNETIALSRIQHDAKLVGYTLRRLDEHGLPGISGSENMMLIETEYIKGQSLDDIYTQELLFLDVLDLSIEEGDSMRKREFPLLYQLGGEQMQNIGHCYIHSHDRTFAELQPNDVIDADDLQDIKDEIMAEITHHNIVDIISQACEGAHHAHQAGVLHRDIKPLNIMVGESGEVKVIDWGLVRLREEFAPRKKSTAKMLSGVSSAGEILGTMRYFAPEMFDENIAPEDVYTVQSDIWAMGVTLSEVLTGYRPFDGATSRKLIESLKLYKSENLEKVEKLLGNTPMLWWIIKKAVAQKLSERFHSMYDMAFALDLFNGMESRKEFQRYLLIHLEYMDDSIVLRKADTEASLNKKLNDYYNKLHNLSAGPANNLEEMMDIAEECLIIAAKMRILQDNSSSQ